ncbi:amidase [Chromatiales bacterium (ex Bugula neritina AB1)]|nr:amidase [Chromatiales bacterium (ex Bugula neritina AB1)]
MRDVLHTLEICDLSRLIQSRELSPVEVTRYMLERIDSLDSQLHAFALLTPEHALQQAQLAEDRLMRRQYLGPLHGVPVALKDLCFTKGIATAAGMPLHRDYVPTFDGTAASRLAEAGAVLLGKLQLTEGAFTEHHPEIPVPVNPWGEDSWSGASSTGSGVALAAGLCFGATGSDTGGSIRFPCAANGVTGIKPTWGRVSVYGAFELAASLDHLGPMARSAADCAILLQELAGADYNDPRCSLMPVPDYLAGDIHDLRDFRLGIDAQFNSADVDSATQQMLSEVISVLCALGVTVVPVQFPDYQSAIEDWGPICAIEAAFAHQRTWPSQKDQYGPTLGGLLSSAEGISAAAYQAMLLRRKDFSGRLEQQLFGVDAMLIPAQTRASPTIAEMAALGEDPAALSALIRFTAPLDMSGHPAITLPGGFGPRDTPIAFQLVGRYFSEQSLVRAGRAYQLMTDWHKSRPKTI